MQLEILNIAVGFADTQVLDDLTLALTPGEIGCLLGASGCGKTTALRAVAGFEPLRQGQIVVDDRQISRPGFTLPPQRRRVGMVFQDYALFPHLSAADNIAFGLRHLKGDARRARVREMLDLVGLGDLAHSYPHQLSGGQQQRVAVARALAPDPALILMDEPFSNLDVELRERLSLEVRAILKKAGTTALIVTHDQNEAFAIADRIGLMHQGRIEQWDTPYNLYHRPASRLVAKFIGQGVLIPGVVGDNHHIHIPMGCLPALSPLPPRTVVDVLLRPDDIVHDDASALRARVVAKAFRGASTLYTLELSCGSKVLSLAPSHRDHAIGASIGIRLNAEHVVAFPVPGAAQDQQAVPSPSVEMAVARLA
ncbi:MAG: ABC transporter ATP-binding protein [Bacteroidales bacterium]|nr:ABC transporter ATP-binding protein [Bacteroidales bacterium]